MSDWFLVNEKQPGSAAQNMARDEFLFNLCHQKKVGFLRIYSWQEPTFSIGFSQSVQKAVNLDFILKNGYSLVRRLTGGKAVFHHDEITYAVISSEDIFYKDHDLYQSYSLIADILIRTLKGVGIQAGISKGSSAGLAKSNFPCFSFPTAREIEINGKKIIGSAQKRDKNALLQHGSIIISMNYQAYAQGANFSAKLLSEKMTTLTDESSCSKDDLIDSLINHFETFIQSKLQKYEFGDKNFSEVTALEEKYQSKEWNFHI